MSFILPVVTSVVLFGSTFDLRTYEFKNYQIYDKSVIPKYTQVTDINTVTAEYFLVDTFTEFRKVLGVDVATGLKALVDEFPHESLKNYDFTRAARSEVKIVIKLSMRKVNESLPSTTPTADNWKSGRRGPIGSHYVKSMVRGADVFIILFITGKNQQHADRIKQTVASRFEKSGEFGLPFKEKFDAVLNEHGVGYRTEIFGSILSEYLPLNDIEDVLALKDNFQKIAKINGTVNEGSVVSYEMQSLSFIDPELPLVQTNREIFPILELVEMKYEDLKVAYDDYIYWRTEGAGRFIPEKDLSQEDAFYTSLTSAKEAMELGIGDMDITAAGNINQFEDAFNKYGERGITRKYRDWLNELKTI